jgi:DNA repair exonuclease SbcCD ATPase subunit
MGLRPEAEAVTYYAENRERIRERIRAYRKANPEKIREQRKARREKDRTYYAENRERILARTRAYEKTNQEKIRARRAAKGEKRRNDERARNLRKLDLTLADYDAMLAAQGGRCAVCGTRHSGSPKTKRLAVDHKHGTKRVRGLLCIPCNAAIGLVEDNPEILRLAVAYLERHEAERLGQSREALDLLAERCGNGTNDGEEDPILRALLGG